jgi:hypothetical protein
MLLEAEHIYNLACQKIDALLETTRFIFTFGHFSKHFQSVVRHARNLVFCATLYGQNSVGKFEQRSVACTELR